MKLLEGKKIKSKILQELKKKIAVQKNKPGLAVVLVGNNKASEVYVALKEKAAGEIGMDFWLLRFSANDSEKDILQAIRELNQDGNIHGIIVQLPLPGKFNTQKIINAIDPKKDADGFHPTNVKKFIEKRNTIWPVFPMAIMELIKQSKRRLTGKKAIVVANSDKFGKIMSASLEKFGVVADYILVKDVKAKGGRIREADILVVAVGKPGVIKKEMLKPGVIIIDGGITKRGKAIFGDVDNELVKDLSGFLSPVPGGVGPVTIACLLRNVYLASKLK